MEFLQGKREIMYHFIVNTKSRTGKAKKLWEEIKRELDDHSVKYDYQVTEYAGHAVEIARKLVRKYEAPVKIVVIGGDGTFNEVINGIKNHEKVQLGYIPTGSGNEYLRNSFPSPISPNPFVHLPAEVLFC